MLQKPSSSLRVRSARGTATGGPRAAKAEPARRRRDRGAIRPGAAAGRRPRAGRRGFRYRRVSGKPRTPPKFRRSVREHAARGKKMRLGWSPRGGAAVVREEHGRAARERLAIKREAAVARLGLVPAVDP